MNNIGINKDIKEANEMSFDHMYRDAPNGMVRNLALNEEDRLVRDIGIMFDMNFDHLLNDTAREELIKMAQGNPKDIVLNEDPRQPMTQPIFTKSRKLNKGSQTSGWEQNRINYQKLHDRFVKCTETALNLNDYEIMEYAVGNKFRKHHGLTWNHFDWVSPAGKSFNPTNREERYHFMCWRDEVCTVVNAIKIK